VQQILEAQAQNALLPPSHPYANAVRSVGQRIARVASDGYGGGAHTHMQHMDWEFAVVQSPTPNAFVVPGGKARAAAASH
jgi:predicted Zn-dependent protease